MRVAALRTSSPSCWPIIDPLRRLGHEVQEFVYFDPNYPSYRNLHPWLPGKIDAFVPDIIVMLGQNDDQKGNTPPPYVLDQIARKYPFIHICCDGSESVWWGQLQQYPFAFHVNIDGVRRGFFEKDTSNRITTLCPIDHLAFRPKPWNKRTINVGFCGGWGLDAPNNIASHPRSLFINAMVLRDIPVDLKHRAPSGDPFPDYEGYRDYLCSCRCVFNHAATGTGDRMHVKARVLETAYAGALVLEQHGSPLADWIPDFSGYTTYDGSDIYSVTERSEWLLDNLGEAEKMASDMREWMIEEHSAGVFWPKIFGMVGL